MKATIDTATIAAAHAAKVSAGNIKVGAVHVGRVALREVHIDHPEGTVELRGVRILLELSTLLDVRFEAAGIVRTARFAQEPVRLSLLHRDVRVALPKGIRALRVGEIAVTDVDATATSVEPTQPLELGELVARAIQASTIESADPRPLVPSPHGRLKAVDSIVVEGLRNHDLDELDELGTPGPAHARPARRTVAVESVTIGEASLGTLPIARLSMAGPAVPRVDLEPIRGENVVIDGPAVVREWKDDDGVLQGSLRIEASARLEIDSVEIRMAAELAVGAVEISDVRLPIVVEDLRLSSLGLTNIDVPRIEID